LLYGENEFAIGVEKKRLCNAYINEHDPIGLEIINAESIDEGRIRDAVSQLPFLVESKLVILQSVFSNKLICDVLAELVSEVPDSIDVVLIESRPDKRTRLFKLLQKNKQAKEFVALKGSGLTSWIVSYAKDLGSGISQADSQHLIDRVGTDQMMLARELEKLSYVQVITRRLIDELVEPALHTSVFDMLDSTFSGQPKTALKMYQTLIANKIDPAEIIGVIAWQLHAFALIKYAGNLQPNEVAQQTGLHPFVVNKSLRIVHRLTASDIKMIVSRTLEIDRGIKTGQSNSEDALRVLILELSST
jgi:DNA polymerase-3 subunit delta